MNTKKTYPSADPLHATPEALAQPRRTLSARALWSLVAVLVLMLIAGLAFLASRRAARPLKTIALSEAQVGSQVLSQVGDVLESLPPSG